MFKQIRRAHTPMLNAEIHNLKCTSGDSFSLIVSYSNHKERVDNHGAGVVAGEKKACWPIHTVITAGDV